MPWGKTTVSGATDGPGVGETSVVAIVTDEPFAGVAGALA